MTTSNHTIGDGHWTPRRERLLLLTLAAIHFTTIVDFMIVMPLQTQFMRDLGIGPHEFKNIVSSYGLSAGVIGLVAGFFLDWFDRKRALLLLYAGFTIGTLFCAISPTYEWLVASRLVAGGFGGVVGAVILAIVGDVVPVERRGAAMGVVMSAFSIGSIAGVPLGLYLAEKFRWQTPFYAIAGLSALVLAGAAWVTPQLRGHMRHADDQHPVAKTWAVMVHPDHQKAFIFMAFLTCTGFLVFPYMAGYMVCNSGLTEKQLPLIYLFGGLATLVSMNLVGRWADKAGKLRVFTIVSLTTAAPILAMTNLPKVSLATALCVSTLLFVCMSSRMVPAMAMMTALVEARHRGGFMSINSSVQMFSMGLASHFGGMILGLNSRGQITGFPISGLLAIAFGYSCIFLARRMRAPETSTAEPMVLEAG